MAPQDRSVTLDRLQATLAEHLASSDRDGAVRAALEAVRSGGCSVDELYRFVLGPLLADIGAGWQAGRTAVWQEHFATATVRTIVEGLYLETAKEAEQTERLGTRVLLACPPGEQHDLGMRMVADRMRIAGWETYFLGADTPVPEIVEAARALEVDLVAISAATHYSRVLLREVIDALKRELPGVRIGVGGPAFDRDPAWKPDEVLTECGLGIVHDGTCEA